MRSIVGVAWCAAEPGSRWGDVNNSARAFYEKHGFRASLIEPMALMITIEEARRAAPSMR
jgi:hypothetical protein